jgi:hypothetical protein
MEIGPFTRSVEPAIIEPNVEFPETCRQRAQSALGQRNQESIKSFSYKNRVRPIDRTKDVGVSKINQ